MQQPPDDAVRTYLESLPRKRVAAGIVAADRQGAVLLVKPTYKDLWEIPGGMAESGESPRAAVQREIREELGLDTCVGRLLAWDWVSPGNPLPEDGLMLLFDVAPLDVAAIRLAHEELSDWAWVPVADLDRMLPAIKARRLVAALHALTSGETIELHDGYRVGE